MRYVIFVSLIVEQIEVCLLRKNSVELFGLGLAARQMLIVGELCQQLPCIHCTSVSYLGSEHTVSMNVERHRPQQRQLPLIELKIIVWHMSCC